MKRILYIEEDMSGVEDLEDEVWKDVVSFEGLYEVSNTGRVRKTLSKQHLNVYKVKDGFMVHLSEN